MRPLLTISATILLATFCQGAPFSRKVFEKVSEVAENAEDMLNVKVKVATTSLDAVVEAFRFHLKDPVGAMQQAKEVTSCPMEVMKHIMPLHTFICSTVMPVALILCNVCDAGF